VITRTSVLEEDLPPGEPDRGEATLANRHHDAAAASDSLRLADDRAGLTARRNRLPNHIRRLVEGVALVPTELRLSWHGHL